MFISLNNTEIQCYYVFNYFWELETQSISNTSNTAWFTFKLQSSLGRIPVVSGNCFQVPWIKRKHALEFAFSFYSIRVALTYSCTVTAACYKVSVVFSPEPACFFPSAYPWPEMSATPPALCPQHLTVLYSHFNYEIKWENIMRNGLRQIYYFGVEANAIGQMFLSKVVFLNRRNTVQLRLGLWLESLLRINQMKGT